MNFYINKKILSLSILGNLIIFNAAQAALPFMKTDINVKNLIQTVINKGQDELCRERGEFRKSKGDGCKKDPTMARLALVVCKDVKDFNKSECYVKAITRLGYADAAVDNAKQYIVKTLSENSIYKDFFCGPARHKFVGHLKEIANQCKTEKMSVPSSLN